MTKKRGLTKKNEKKNIIAGIFDDDDEKLSFYFRVGHKHYDKSEKRNLHCDWLILSGQKKISAN